MALAMPTDVSSLSLPAGSYIYTILPTSTFLALISSDDSIRLIDPATLREVTNGTFNGIHDGVTCLETSGHGSNLLLTAGRDAVVRGWDARLGRKAFEYSDGSGAPYLSLASRESYIAAGTELTNSQATVCVWDQRNPSKILKYVECHNDDVTALQFHPTNPHRLLSGSTDGLVNIYDTTITDEDDALLQVINHGSSISHAGFLSPSQLFALSHDEIFSIYDVESDTDANTMVAPAATTTSTSSPSQARFGDLRPLLNCEYIVDVVKVPSATPNSTSGNSSSSGEEAILGAGSHSPSNLDLMPLRLDKHKQGATWRFDKQKRVRLPGAHGAEVVRSMCFRSHAQTIFTAGEDGNVRAWRIDADADAGAGDAGGEEMEGVEDEMGERKEEKGKKKKRESKTVGESAKGRFKPY